jgi:putative flippase GtrA
MQRPHVLNQFRKFATVGILAATTDFCAYGLLIRFAGFTPVAANLVSRPMGGLVSFAFNKLWTFERRQVSGSHREFARFWFVWLIAYAASTGLVGFFNRRLGLGPALTKLFAEGLVAGAVFLTHRLWTFRHP